MTDALVESVRLRGPHAARLARVAAGQLPAALDRALAGLAPGRVDNVTVVLDIDIDGSDDATIAAIWAHEVRVEVARHLDASAPPRPAGSTARHAQTPAVTGDGALAAALAWLASATPRGPVPRTALTLAAIVSDHPDSPWAMSAQVRTAIIQLDRAIIAERESLGAPATPQHALTPESDASGSPSPADRPAILDSEAPSQLAPDPDSSGGLPGLRSEATHGHTAEELARAAAARLGTLAELAGGDADARLDVDDLTSAAGLALLYPWLTDVCRSAENLHPGVDPVDVRAFALAALVDPADDQLTDDPLVRVLAGATPRPPRSRIRLPRADAVVAEAERALESFASLLPGFESSSAEFVRREWVKRTGLLERDREPMRLTAATHPLDVVLMRLPYPVSLFKLPWSPPITVRFRP